MEGKLYPEKQCSKCGRTFPRTTAYFRPGGTCLECAGLSFGLDGLDPGEKRCSKCKQKKPATYEYFPISRKKNGEFLSSWCKECYREYRGQTKDKGREYSRRSAQKPEIRERRRKNALKHKESARVRHLRRRAREKSARVDFTPDQWKKCLEYWNYSCAICGMREGLWHVLAADHWIPLSKGGTTSVDNIIPLCHATKGGHGGCNRFKTDRDPVEWLIERYGHSKAQKIILSIESYFRYVRGEGLT